MKVVFFAQSRVAAACPEFHLPVEGSLTPAEFWARLIAVFPDLAPLRKTARLARCETYLSDDERLQPQDEIAVIPAVSGG
jgi:molybdopterin converting factor small subunit